MPPSCGIRTFRDGRAIGNIEERLFFFKRGLPTFFRLMPDNIEGMGRPMTNLTLDPPLGLDI
jgi:hypothetical protein